MEQATQDERREPWVPADTFGTRLLLVRRELGLTTEQAAEQCGLKVPTWNTWENGVSPQRLNEVVKQISDGLGVNRDWLMWGSTSARKRNSDHLEALPSMFDRRCSSPARTPLLAVVRDTEG